MKSWWTAGMAVLLTATMGIGAWAQGTAPADVEAVAQAAPEEGAFVTQAELARRLVERMGLWRHMGTARPSDVECFAALMAVGISPTEDGWEAETEVTAAMLARVLVQALGRSREVSAARRDDPEAWMAVLRTILEDMGLIETVEGALSVLTPDEGIRAVIEWYALTGDELRRRLVPDSVVLRIIDDIELPPVRPPPDVTPDLPVVAA